MPCSKACLAFHKEAYTMGARGSHRYNTIGVQGSPGYLLPAPPVGQVLVYVLYLWDRQQATSMRDVLSSNVVYLCALNETSSSMRSAGRRKCAVLLHRAAFHRISTSKCLKVGSVCDIIHKRISWTLTCRAILALPQVSPTCGGSCTILHVWRWGACIAIPFAQTPARNR
jgi:hypothetical protein